MIPDGGPSPDRVRELARRVSDMEAGFLALSDGKFDADVYRKALELTAREHVYTRLLNVIAAITLVAGVAFWMIVQSMVDRAVTGKVEQLQSLEVSVRRERLLDLLQTLDERTGLPGESREELLGDIRGLPGYQTLLTSVALSPRSDRELRLVLHYVVGQRDHQIAEAVINQMIQGGTVGSARIVAESLATFELSPDLLARLRPAVEDARPAGTVRHALVLLFATVQSPPDWVTRLMAEACRSNVPGEAETAMTFFVMNPDAWQAEWRPGGKLTRGPLGALLQLVEVQRSAEPTQRDEARASNLLSDIEGTLRTEMDEQMLPFEAYRERLQRIERMRVRLSLHFLERGFRAMYGDVMRSGYYPDPDWEVVQALFPEYRPTERYGPDTREEIQDALWRERDLYEWAGDRYRRGDSPDVTSLGALESGNLSPYLSFMSTSYYDEAVWVSRVWPLFRDGATRSGTLPMDGDPSGADREQDDLWHWVEDNEDALAWNARESRFDWRE